MGRRPDDTAIHKFETETQPQFSPVPSQQDVGRQPARSYGKVQLDRIMPDPNQPRRVFDEAELAALADSLAHTGQLQSIRVRWYESEQKWMIIAGERRYRAATLAGLRTLDCYFEATELTVSKTIEQQLVENLQREDLNAMEEALAYAQLMQINEWNGKQLAATLKITPSRISRAVALLRLPENIREQIQVGQLAATTAYELTKISNPRLQEKLASDAVEGKATQREIVAALKHHQKQRRGTVVGVNLTFLADNGLRVQVRSARKQNYHEVLEALQQSVEDVQLRIDSQIFL